MVQALAGVSFLGLIGVSLVVGTRLLWLARRTRQLPELTLGLSLLVVMGVAYPGMVLLDVELGWSSAAQRAVMFALNVALDAGFLLIYVFTARVFRRGSPAGQIAVAGAAIALLIHLWLVGQVLATTPDLAAGRAATSLFGLLSLGTASGAYAWSGAESLAHWRRLVRRRRLGLVDAVACNRMWLWAMMSFVTVTGSAVNALFLVQGIDVLTRPEALFVTSLTGLGQGALLWLTFLPPRSYREWVERRTKTHAA